MKLVDEQEFTPWAEAGWHARDAYAPEVEVCEAVREIVRILQPDVVIETGVGSGLLSGYIQETLNGRWIGFESDEAFRGEGLDSRPTPGGSISEANLVVLDSGPQWRDEEIRRWWEDGKGFAFIHDTGNGHDAGTSHGKRWLLIQELSIPGIRYGNPRGSFLGWHTPPERNVMNRLMSLMPVLQTCSNSEPLS